MSASAIDPQPIDITEYNIKTASASKNWERVVMWGVIPPIKVF
jgi:hypothetical protein